MNEPNEDALCWKCNDSGVVDGEPCPNCAELTNDAEQFRVDSMCTCTVLPEDNNFLDIDTYCPTHGQRQLSGVDASNDSWMGQLRDGGLGLDGRL